MMNTSNVSVTNKRKRSFGLLLALGLTLFMSVRKSSLAAGEWRQASALFLNQETQIFVRSAGNVSRHHNGTNGGSKIAETNVTQYPAVEWLEHPEIGLYDMFSDSWMMNKQMFLESDLESITTVEGACLDLFRERMEKGRMALDWLDFSVEHMSMWWRVLGAPDYDYALDRVTSILDNYRIERLEAADSYDRTILRPTIALIAFQQYISEEDQSTSAGRQLTVSSLSATIASLIQVGMGRIVVVGYKASDEEVVHEAFRLFSGDQKHTGFIAHGTELAFARVNDDMVNSTHDAVNLPKASLVGLRLAMTGDDEVWIRAWMGENPSQWKYVYLTEPDTILNTRPSTLRSLEKALQDGLILAPHRLQPIPYQDDVPEYNVPESRQQVAFVPSDFKTPVMMDPLAGDVCCDEQAGPEYKPGAWKDEDHDNGQHCGDFWWRCGFGASSNNFTRMEAYKFMRLKQGTGVVSLAGTEHGRRCIPKKKGRCERRMRVNHPDRPDSPWRTKK